MKRSSSLQGLVVLFATLFTLMSGLALAETSRSPVTFLTGPQEGEPITIALDYIRAHRADYGLSEGDLAEIVVKDHYRSKHNGVTHLYFRQRFDGIEVWNGDININIASDGRVINMGSRFVSDLAGALATRVPTITPEQAITEAAAHFGTPVGEIVMLVNEGGPMRRMTFGDSGIAHGDINAKLMILPPGSGAELGGPALEEPRLVWSLIIDRVDSDAWWDLLVDATTGQAVAGYNYTSHGGVPADAYSVIPVPAEHPEDVGGAQTSVVGPADSMASPFGWHDTDGDVDPDFTDTRGNNVDAHDDLTANNVPGLRPSGGAGPLLDFDYAFDEALGPAEGTNLEAAIVNLFYYNNIMHDITYQYGFDEPSGNFQENNYGNGGAGGDSVLADAQDGSGTNNANFSTPSDGFNPRMQMFVWLAPPDLVINMPGSIAGTYTAGGASFGSVLDSVGLTGNVALVDDGVAPNTDFCEAVAGTPLAGLIALIDRGGCEFGVKVLNAENAGAIAAIVVNNQGDGVLNMGPGAVGGSVTIPSIFIGQTDGQAIKNSLQATTVNVTMRVTRVDRDSDLDNGIIAHEYGHGISNRLIGGPNNVSCLTGNERAGEGWSDFWTLVLSAKPAQTGDQSRGIGTYTSFEPSDGNGIRNFPYSTDLAINPQTYSGIAGTNVPHGVGEIWMSMVWEVYWEMVQEYGFDPDFYGGDGGNNRTIQLVIDSMKLQPCGPTFIDARDAMLMADQTNYGGANQCRIWRGFAKRGLGLSASTASTGVGDEVEAFDLPEGCDNLFSNGFESGDTSAWSSSTN